MNKINEGEGTTRRRGSELEAAIIQAAWEELMEVGFHNLTIEGVAARAQTSKPVIYRRWPNREELVLAAILNHLPAVSEKLPDTGKLRSDVLLLLNQLNEILHQIGPKTIHGLMSVLSGIPFSDILNFRRTNAMTILLNRAAERGEIRPEKITPRITRLPVDLVRHEWLITLEPVSMATMEEIVDEIFLPLLK
ncbi:TetR/AcrR family transcriptional regulator [Paenibacillus phoenicis]|uniref:TetR/AcrR family transcriptional regulator n=1 Tax=Paenibacillus phoenicis TaxID=554117 RepID=A0ABU5PSE9_9BACL|nr:MULTISPECIES: TetR/AcrR family transcriptional regulator [Paenibacillus]MCT2193560.1 TetR/AcrR family transcriptional regulator [Paenibacillus sp. p3-SID1389]MEA3572587.1 TetR/AcrR family transcriptional regulator [Paenibacillus phoenicis]